LARRSTIPWVVLPTIAVALYFLTWSLAPSFFLRFVASEQGIVELGTAAFFLAAAGLAAHLAIVARGSVPGLFRAFYAIFAVAGVFVALEEISYGQHLFGWHSPEYFREHNLQGEVNCTTCWQQAEQACMVANLGTMIGFGALPGLFWLDAQRPSTASGRRRCRLRAGTPGPT
jgi:hypothetical protein